MEVYFNTVISFSWANNVLICEYILFYYLSIIDGHLDVFQILNITNNCGMEIHAALYKSMFQSMNMCLQVEFSNE